MVSDTPLLTRIQIDRLFNRMIRDPERIDLNDIRDCLQTFQTEIRKEITQTPTAYTVLQDLIIDLETAEEAIEDAIQGMNTLMQEN